VLPPVGKLLAQLQLARLQSFNVDPTPLCELLFEARVSGATAYLLEGLGAMDAVKAAVHKAANADLSAPPLCLMPYVEHGVAGRHSLRLMELQPVPDGGGASGLAAAITAAITPLSVRRDRAVAALRSELARIHEEPLSLPGWSAASIARDHKLRDLMFQHGVAVVVGNSSSSGREDKGQEAFLPRWIHGHEAYRQMLESGSARGDQLSTTATAVSRSPASAVVVFTIARSVSFSAFRVSVVSCLGQ
jgi:hypothetical protein